MADLIDTHVGQFVACFGDGRQFVFGDDLEEVIARIPKDGALPRPAIEAVPARDEILIL